MSQTTWFIFSAFVLIEGLNYLWSSPTVDNWFLIVGIFGHAFIASAVIAASFHYFLDATAFTQSVMNKKMMPIKESMKKS
ncbi:MAG: putative membrane protein [Anaerolineae bacterium 49_20]|nr:MAG: putative membrane protein [Anaerolineae bacterium 49_20]